MKTRTLLATLAMVAALAMLAVACGSDSSASDTSAAAPSGPTINLRGQHVRKQLIVPNVSVSGRRGRWWASESGLWGGERNAGVRPQ